MKKFVIAVLLLLATAALADDKKPRQPERVSAAPVTTYTVAVGDILVYHHYYEGIARKRVEETREVVYANHDQTTVHSRNEFGPLRTWFQEKNVLKKFLNISATRTAYRVRGLNGDFSIPSVRLEADGRVLWISVNKRGHSQFPNMLQYSEQGYIKTQLVEIRRPKKSR